MNIVFRVVWNAALQAFVVAPEFAKAHGKRGSARRTVGAVVLMLSASAVGPACAGALDGGSVLNGLPSSIAYGPGAVVRAEVGKDSAAIGSDATVLCTKGGCDNSIAIGAKAKADGLDTTAVGAYSFAQGVNATALGNQVEVLSDNAVGIGANQFGSGSGSDGSGIDSASSGAIAIGYSAGVRKSINAIAIGAFARSAGAGAISLGSNSTAGGDQSIAIGTGTNVAGARSGAIGYPTVITGSDSYSLGNNNNIAQNNTFVIGNAVTSTQGNSVILGNGSTDRAAGTTSNATIAGVSYGPFAGPGIAANGVVSVGAIGKERQLINVAAGQVSANSTDAINGSQLYSIANNLGTNLNTLAAGVSAGLGGGAAYSPATGGWTGPSFTVQGTGYNNVGSALGALDASLSANNTKIASNIVAITNLTNGTAGLVQQAAAGQKLTVGKDTDGSDVDFADKGGNARKLTNVTEGTVAASSKDAVNGSQLFATNQQVATNTTNIAGNTTAINNINTAVSTGTIGLVQQAAAGQTLTVGKDTDGSDVDFADKDGNARKLTNVIDGTVAANSKDAVNGSQHFATNQQVATNTTNIAGNTTAINNINTAVSTGTIGLVQQAAAGQKLTVGKDTDGSDVDFADKDGNARKLTNVIDGTVAANSKDAVNGSQLFATNQQVATNTTNIAGNTTAINNINTAVSTGTIGLVQQAAAGQKLTVGKDTDGSDVDFADKGGNARKLTNVIDGTVAASSKDAVNGSQLFATNQQVATNTTNIAGNTTAINNINTAVSTGTIGLVQQAAAGQKLTVGKDTDGSDVDFADKGGNARKLTNVTEGTVAASSKDAVNGSQLFATNQQVATNTTNIAGNTTAINNINTAVSTGTIGLVQQAAVGQKLTVGKDTDGSDVDFADKGGNARKLTNVTEGTVAASSKDAVNGSQLFTTNQAVAALDGQLDTLGADTAAALGGGAAYDPSTGTWTVPSYTIQGAPYSTVGSALGALDKGLTTTNGNVNNLTNTVNNLSAGTVGLVQQTAAGQKLTVGKDTDGSDVDFADKNGDTRKLTNVTDGTVAANSKDVVNGGQLFTTKQAVDVLDGQLGTLGAGTAAALGGGAAYDQSTGTWTAPSYTIQGSSYSNVGTALGALDTGLTSTNGNVTNLTKTVNSLTAGTVGLVQQAAAGQKLTVGKDIDGPDVDFADKDGNSRRLNNVNDGTVAANSKDAVNGGQLHELSYSMANAMGGGSTVKTDGSVSTPVYNLTNPDGSITAVTGVEGAISNLDGRIDQNAQAIAGNTTQIKNLTNQINSGGQGLVKQDSTTSDITVAKDSKGKKVSFAGTDGERTLTGVAAGQEDKDAVNVGQLKEAGVVDASGKTKSVVTYDDDSESSLTLGGSEARSPVVLHNLANGVADHDAINVGQLNERLATNSTQVLNDANSYTDSRVDDVWRGLSRDLDAVNRQANRGIAAASALIDVTPYVPGHTVVNAGIATYRGEAALGVGMSRWSDNGRVNLNAGVSASKGDSPVVRVGVGYIF